MKLLALLFVFISFSLGSCIIQCDTNPAFEIAYQGFDTTDTKGIYIVSYEHKTNFTKPTSIFIYKDTNIYPGYTSHDTMFGSYYNPDVDHDFIINIPNASRTYKVRDLSYQQISGQYPGSEWTCENAASWYVNDVPQHYDGVKPVKHGTTQYAVIGIVK